MRCHNDCNAPAIRSVDVRYTPVLIARCRANSVFNAAPERLVLERLLACLGFHWRKLAPVPNRSNKEVAKLENEGAKTMFPFNVVTLEKSKINFFAFL